VNGYELLEGFKAGVEDERMTGFSEVVDLHHRVNDDGRIVGWEFELVISILGFNATLLQRQKVTLYRHLDVANGATAHVWGVTTSITDNKTVGVDYFDFMDSSIDGVFLYIYYFLVNYFKLFLLEWVFIFFILRLLLFWQLFDILAFHHPLNILDDDGISVFKRMFAARQKNYFAMFFIWDGVYNQFYWVFPVFVKNSEVITEIVEEAGPGTAHVRG